MIKLDDYASESGFMSLDEYAKKHLGIFRVEDYMREMREFERPHQADVASRGIEDPSTFKKPLGLEIADTFDNVLQGILESGSLGLVDTGVRPENTIESVGGAVGNFAGFALVPMKLGAAGATKLFKMAKLAKPASAAGKIASRVGRTTVGLGLGEAVSDVTNLEEAPERFAHGAAMGTLFGALGLAHVADHPVLSQVFRQGAVRAAMALGGQYPEGYFDKENLAHAVWGELLNTYFMRHGIDPRNLITGKLTAKQQARVDSIANAVEEVNRRPRGMSIATSFFRKPMIQEVSLNEIYTDPSSYPPEALTTVKGTLSSTVEPGTMPKGMGLRLSWDETLGKWRTDRKDAIVDALRELNIERQANDPNESGIDKVKVQIIKPKPGVQFKLRTPAEVASSLFHQNTIDTGLIEELSNTTFWAGTPEKFDGKFGGIRAMGQSLSESQKRLRKNEILYEIRFNVGQDGARVLQLVPVAAGTRAREKYSEKAGKALPTQDAAIALRQARWHLRSIEKAIQENPTDQALQTERAESAYRVDQLERAHEPFMSKNMTVLDVATAHINARVATIRSVPEAALPEAYHREVNSRILASKVGLKSAEEMLNIMGIPKDPTGKRTIRLKHMPSIEQMLMRIEAAPVEDRMHIMMEPWKDRNHLDHPELTGDLKKDQAEIDSIPKRNLRQRISEAVAEQKRTGAPMLQTLFRLTVPETLLDFRYFALKMQERTPIPMWDIGVRIANAMHLRDNKVAVVSRWLQPFARSTSEDHQVVKQYFTNLYSGIGDVNLVKTPTQQAFIDAITSMMQEVAPDVVKYRHRKWMLNVLYPQQEGTVSNVKVFKLQNNPKVRAMLEEGARIYEQAQADHNWDPYEMWVDRAIAQNLGVIQSGAYLPGHILNVKPIKLEVLDEVGHISALGRTAGEMRESNIINGEDASHMIVDQFRGQNLIVQLNNYLNQIYNLRYLGEPMNLLSEAVDFYKPYLEGAKEKASTRRGSEARAYSTLDYLKIYAARAKGYPMKMELPSRLLRGAQTVFFRALTVKPNTWLRNMWQGVHTVPHKEFVTDVRFSAPKFSFKHLPENAMSFYDIATDGSTDFAKFFLGIHSTGQLSKYNILDKALQLVENVGKVFAKTDDINRRTVFAKTWFRSKFYLDKYAAGDIERHNMYNRLGIDKMKPLEQRTFRELLQAKDNEQAASFIADWQVKNSQWVYNRAARSLAEMTPGGEAWSNLLTWTKSLVQQNVNCLHQIKDGLERAKTVEGNAWDINTPRGRAYRQAMHGGLQIGGLVLASAVGNAIMANATLSHKTKFTSYGWGALTWEFGGVTNAVLTEFTTTLADVVQAFDGTDEDRKMSFEKLAKIGDNMALRQLVPFAKQALSIMEAATNRSYIAPVYELMTKITRGQSRGVTQVDRTVLERLTHAVFGTDPSKSKEIRELAYKSREEYQYKYMHAQNPVEREYYRLALARARYFADLFTRYEPIEVFKHWEEKEREKYMKEMQDHSQEDYIKEMQRLAREERKQKMGY